jgi:hypothetical protein
LKPSLHLRAFRCWGRKYNTADQKSQACRYRAAWAHGPPPCHYEQGALGGWAGRTADPPPPR